MTVSALSAKAASYLRRLCLDIPSRRVGSEGNREATDFFAGVAESFGWRIRSPAFDCIDWHEDGVELVADGTSFEAFASPFSLGCRVRAPLAVVAGDGELEGADLAGKVVLLCGEVAREQLMPKNFPFYNPDRHRRVVALLEAGKPLAIVAATARDVQMVGSQYPFPLFEDGDFDIPSVYLTDLEGDRLAAYAGREVALLSRAWRVPARGCNVVARRGGGSGRRVVLFAHIDAKRGTPGALDNASGVAVLLLLAERLAGYEGRLEVELVAMNGEDYYSSPGERLYLAENEGRFGEILLGVNIDGVAYREGRVAYSLYGCPETMAQAIRGAFAAHDVLVEGGLWYQGDHGLFLLNGAPALALTSELAAELLAEVVHTAEDVPELVDPARLAGTALALGELVGRLALEG